MTGYIGEAAKCEDVLQNGVSRFLFEMPAFIPKTEVLDFVRQGIIAVAGKQQKRQKSLLSEGLLLQFISGP